MSGKLFQDGPTKAEPILSKYAPTIQQEIIDKLLATRPYLSVVPIGSVGKKHDDDYNGDIDIAVGIQTIKQLQYIIVDTFAGNETVTNKSYRIVSMKYPYTIEGKTRYVAVDFMLMCNEQYTKFRYYCPDYRKNESRYKVGTKLMLIDTILNHCDAPLDLEPGYKYKYVYDPMYLYINYWDQENHCSFDRKVTENPQDVVDIMFKDCGLQVCNSVETIWTALHSDKFRYPNRVKDIEMAFFINSYKKGWGQAVKPEELQCQYWTVQQIYDAYKPYEILRNINKILVELQHDFKNIQK